MFGATFGSLEISLILNNSFSFRNVFQTGFKTLSKMVLKKYFFLSKSSIFLCSLDHTISFKFHQHVVQILIK